MRHIALTSFADGPCNGAIEVQALQQNRPTVLHLPILGAQPVASATHEWRCLRCGQRWLREPLPQEAL